MGMQCSVCIASFKYAMPVKMIAYSNHTCYKFALFCWGVVLLGSKLSILFCRLKIYCGFRAEPLERSTCLVSTEQE